MTQQEISNLEARDLRNKKVIIIGCGIGGMAAAMMLSTNGINVQVYEKEKCPGGKI